MKVSWAEVLAHIDVVNRGHRGTPRDFWGAAPFGLDTLSWSLEPVALRNLPEVEPFSRRDVQRYAAFSKKHKSDFPPIILLVTFDVEVLDGAHRVAAAESLGHREIMAYVGRDKSEFAKSWVGA